MNYAVRKFEAETGNVLMSWREDWEVQCKTDTSMGQGVADMGYEVLVQRERSQNGTEEPDKGNRKLQGAE